MAAGPGAYAISGCDVTFIAPTPPDVTAPSPGGAGAGRRYGRYGKFRLKKKYRDELEELFDRIQDLPPPAAEAEPPLSGTTPSPSVSSLLDGVAAPVLTKLQRAVGQTRTTTKSRCCWNYFRNRRRTAGRSCGAFRMQSASFGRYRTASYSLRHSERTDPWQTKTMLLISLAAATSSSPTSNSSTTPLHQTLHLRNRKPRHRHLRTSRLQADQPPQQPAQAGELPRDPQGRFAPKPAQKPQAAPQQQPQRQPEDHRVPLRELLDERERRQRIEAEAQQMRQAWAQFQAQQQAAAQQQQAPQTIFDNPEDYLSQRVIEPLRQEMQARELQRTDKMSREFANHQFGSQAIEAALADMTRIRYTPQGDAIYRQIMATGHPYGALMQWHQQVQAHQNIAKVQQVIGPDPNAWLQAKTAGMGQGSERPASSACRTTSAATGFRSSAQCFATALVEFDAGIVRPAR